MNKLLNKIAVAFVGMAMAVGVGVAVGQKSEVKMASAESVGVWEKLTALNQLEDNMKVLLVTNNDTYYFNGATNNSGHFTASQFSALSAPNSNSAVGVVTLEKLASNKFKMNVVTSVSPSTTTKYVTATQAASGGASLSDSDSDGWLFSYSSGFTAVFQKSGCAAVLRSQGDNNFRTYANNSGKAFQIYKYAAVPVTSITLASSNYTPVNNVISIEKDSEDGTALDTLTPTISPNNATIKAVTWSTNNDAVADVENGEVIIDTSSAGEATITATANDGSGVTASMRYVVEDTSATQYSVSVTATNGSYSPNAPTIRAGYTTSIVFSANSGYKLPTSSSSFSVTNATISSWTRGTGTLVISNPTDNVTISVTMPALENYSITVTATNCTYSPVNPTIQENGTSTITFSANSGYELPSAVSVSGAVIQSWTKATGALILENPTESVSVSVTATAIVYFNKVTQLSDLTVGDSYVVAYSTSLMGNKNASKAYRDSISATSAFSDSNTKINESLIPDGVVTVTLLYAGNNAFYIYDVTNSTYICCSTSGTDCTNNTLANATVYTASFVDGQLRLQVGAVSRYFGYNVDYPRFASYQTTAGSWGEINLYKKVGSSLKTSATSFANTLLKMNDDDYSGEVSPNEGANCATNYSSMKTAYVALSSEVKNIFQYSSDYSDARARMNAWAAANSETFTYGNNTPFAARADISSISGLQRSDSTTLIIVILSLVGLASVGGYLLIRRRKEQ